MGWLNRVFNVDNYVDTSDTSKIVKRDVDTIIQVYDNVSKTQSKIDDMIIEVGRVGNAFSEINKPKMLSALDAAEDSIYIARDMMLVFTDHMTTFGFVKPSIYDIDFKTFKSMYGEYIKYYDAFRAAYDYFFGIYDMFADLHFVPKIPYIQAY